MLNRRIAIVAVAVIATVAFFSFKSGDDRNFQIAKNLDIFNAIVKELDMFYVDTIDPNKTIREGIDNMLFSLDPYTEYYPEEDQSELEQMVKGSFESDCQEMQYCYRKSRGKGFLYPQRDRRNKGFGHFGSKSGRYYRCR